MFDRLDKDLKGKRSDGITIMDVTNMPPLPRRVMILLMRQNHPLGLEEIVQVIQREPSLLVDAPTKKQIIEAVDQLVEEGWIILFGEESDQVTYRANLGRSKTGSDRTRGLWSLLDDKT